VGEDDPARLPGTLAAALGTPVQVEAFPDDHTLHAKYRGPGLAVRRRVPGRVKQAGSLAVVLLDWHCLWQWAVDVEQPALDGIPRFGQQR